MFAVIFEVTPKPDRWDDYLDLAKQLRPELERIDGFIDNERYKSSRTAGRLLSLSTWANEKAVIRWRTHAMHHGVQKKGRFEVFEDYHLRVGEITADTHVPTGHSITESRFDVTDLGVAKAVTISEIDSGADEVTLAQQLRLPTDNNREISDTEVFRSITSEKKLLLLTSWRDAAAAAAWEAPASLPGAGRLRHRRVRIIRDYGMAERGEAPQYYPAVTARGSR